MAVSLRRGEAEATGKPLYKSYADIPPGFLSKTACMKMKQPVRADEEPGAYVPRDVEVLEVVSEEVKPPAPPPAPSSPPPTKPRRKKKKRKGGKRK